jgi:tight adherence protein B
MTEGAVVAAGVLIVVGVLAVVVGLQRRPRPVPTPRASSPIDLWARLTRRPAGRAGRRRDLRLAVVAVAGLLTAALTGWFVAVVLVPLLVLGVPALLRSPEQRDLQVMEALDRWVRALAATMATGRSITDALRVSRRTAPPALAVELGVLVARLNNRWDTEEALRRFADDLGSADADNVVAALVLANQRGSYGATATLNALADSLQDQLKARRLIETERAKPYVVVRQVTLVMGIALAAVLLVNASFFAPYATPLGQVVLAALIVAYLGSLVLMRRRARQQPRPRLLVRSRP